MPSGSRPPPADVDALRRTIASHGPKDLRYRSATPRNSRWVVALSCEGEVGRRRPAGLPVDPVGGAEAVSERAGTAFLHTGPGYGWQDGWQRHTDNGERSYRHVVRGGPPRATPAA